MSDDGFLHRYFLNNSFKLMHKYIHYFDIYEMHLSKYRGKCPVVVEIGTAYGGGLGMWREYFGPGSTIVGIDVNQLAWSGPQIDFFLGSQSDPAVIEAVLRKYPEVDVVIDDGGHIQSDMNATFDLLYHRTKSRSTYIVEDVHTCYWPEYEGGLRRENTFIEKVKNQIDALNAVHTRGALEVGGFTKSTASICCYDSIVVFEKTPQAMRQHIQSQPM